VAGGECTNILEGEVLQLEGYVEVNSPLDFLPDFSVVEGDVIKIMN
jgi:hypothetical protein